ncbi:acetyltransferase [Purpureocillium lavendulum]|uniref:Acetyltransferase n=1 Tax=Purpureocillium lavendulum TaxID=1247861 RepID=A0AB34FV76_9HYPO|nr:acetyltransferase [Purpureocillium lavendulum]
MASSTTTAATTTTTTTTMVTVMAPADADSPAQSSQSQQQGASEAAPQLPPPLNYEVLTDDDDAKRDALQLVADSIAQQRQVASLAVIFHPLVLVAAVVGCTLAWRHNAARDFGTALTACSGVAIAALAAVRLLTSRYIHLAEAFRWRDFIAPPPDAARRDEDLVLVARFGEELIGALVLRLKPAASSSSSTSPSSSATTSAATPTTRGKKKQQQQQKQQKQQNSLQGGSGAIRAWTTKLRYRGRGIGGDLLRFAVMTTRSACDDDAAPVSFDPAHANSAMPMPDMFNRPFRSRDDKARRALAHALRDCDAGDSTFSKDVE